MSVISDFNKRSKTAKGDLNQIAKAFIQARSKDFEYCIVNNLPMYLGAYTQSGKTRFKLWLADWALSTNLVDVVIITTTNLTGAMSQMRDRLIEWAKLNGRQIKSTDDKSAYMIKGDIFVNMTNANRTNRIDAIVAEAERNASDAGKPMPRILVLIDEGEEHHECTLDSRCDIALNNLLLTRNRPDTASICTAKVSATLLSHIIVHGQYSSSLGYLQARQVFQLPTHPDYVGLNIPNFIEPILIDDTEFSGDSYTANANLRNTQNPRRLVAAIETLIKDQAKIERGPIQIGNVVFGRTKDSHVRAAGMIARAFNSAGRTVAIWEKEHFNQLNKSAEVVVIVHNGTANDMAVADKLTLIAHHWNRKNLKAVVIVSKMMTGKSITIETENCRDPSSPEYGFYANFTAYYGPGRENITTAIQAMRCTGIRPAIKRHVMWTTDTIKQEIEGYEDQNRMFVSYLKQVGQLSTTQIIDWVGGQRPIAKASMQKRLGKTKITNRAMSQDIDNSNRSIATEADAYFIVSAAKRKQLNSIESIVEFVQAQGFALASTERSKIEGARVERTYDSVSAARMAFKNFSKGKSVKLHWTKINGKTALYVINNMRTQERVEYAFNELDNGYPLFNKSRVYQQPGSYVYQVA